MTETAVREEPCHVHVLPPPERVLAFDEEALEEFLRAWDESTV